MSSYLLCSSPFTGHFVPMLAIGRHLARHGHRVRMLASRRFEAKVTAAAIEFSALPPECDFDERDLEASFPTRAGKKGLGRLRFDITAMFVDPIPHQYRAIRELLDAAPADAILVEQGFMGIFPLLLGPRAARPPVLAVGITPLTLSSRNLPPFGLGILPMSNPLGRVRDGLLTVFMHTAVFGPSQRAAQNRVQALTGKRLPTFFLDGHELADRFLQLSCPGFEYPRRDLPGYVRFVGPVLPDEPEPFHAPSWWKELDNGRPVVHVTQGTVDNKDLHRLIIPTMLALADKEVTVVATTGGKALPASFTPPANAFVADFIPYDRLLPKVAVQVTNGGYGGVQRALALGIPIVAAGDSEDKPEVASRVAWSGAGINLHTGKPKPDAIARAVGQVLTSPSYRAGAHQLAEESAQYSSLEAIAEELAKAAA